MSLSFPSQPCSVIIGGLLDQLSGFIIRRPVFGALYSKAQAATTPRDGETTRACWLVGLATSFLKSYAVNSLLALTGARDTASSAVVGTLVFFAATGPQLITNSVVACKSWDVIASQVLVKGIETIGLAVALSLIKNRS